MRVCFSVSLKQDLWAWDSSEAFSDILVLYSWQILFRIWYRICWVRVFPAPLPMASKLFLLLVRSLGYEWISCFYYCDNSFWFYISVGSRPEQISCICPCGKYLWPVLTSEWNWEEVAGFPTSKAFSLCLELGRGK